MNNILIDCERMKYANTGLFHFCLNLGKELIKAYDSRDESLFFYVPSNKVNLFGNDQLYLIQHSWHKFFNAGTSRFDVWHSTHQDSSYQPCQKKSRMVLTVHDLNFLIEREKEPYKIKKYLLKIQQKISRADSIVCISEYTRQVLEEHVSVADKAVQVIYNGCNINEFPEFDKPVYRPAKPFLFAIGTLLPKKNFHVLPCLLTSNDYVLVLAGSSNKQYQAKILEQAKLHGVENRVIITGPVSEKDKYWYYKNCLAFLFPSLAEGFGLPVVEAMHFGKPIFISGMTSLPEIGGDVAYYFNNFDPIHMQEVFKNGMQHYYETNAQVKIKHKASQYSWADAAKAYISIYRSLYK